MEVNVWVRVWRSHRQEFGVLFFIDSQLGYYIVPLLCVGCV